MTINQPTVFILGAGASVPFGFPTAWQLKLQVLDHLRRSPNSWDQFIDAADQDKLEPFRRHLEDSPLKSVDAFLEQQPDFLQVGKAAIARALLPLERESSLRGDHGDYDWLGYLFDHIFDSAEQFSRNQISFVTFNYDRSLEQFFATGLRSSIPDLDRHSMAEMIGRIPIIHMYGSLGPLPWQDGTCGLRYEAGVTAASIRRATRNLRVIHERSEDNSAFSEAQERIQNALHVIFLGFSYQEANLGRLAPDRVFASSFRGTTYQMEGGEIADAQAIFEEKFHGKVLVPAASNLTCHLFLRSLKFTDLA